MAARFEYRQAQEIAAAFRRHLVRYLFIGKSGAILLGYPDTTQDADLFLEKSPENGRAVVTALVELAPCFAAAQANLGAAYAELARLPEAAAALEKAVSCNPNYAAGFKNLAAIQLQMGNLDRAITAMRGALRASPADPEIQKRLQELIDFQTRSSRP